MSIENNTAGFTISGVEDEDFITIDAATFSTIIGIGSLPDNDGAFNTVLGTEAGALSTTAESNILIGFRAGYQTNSANNTFIGILSGSSNLTGNHNTYVGMYTGLNAAGDGDGNLLAGNFAAGNAGGLGDHNVFIGYSNSTRVVQGSTQMRNNVAIGAFSHVQGGHVTSLGFSNLTLNSDGSTTIGTRNLTESAPRSIVIGTNIVNRGRDAIILQPSSGTYINDENDHLNIKDVLIGHRIGTISSGHYETLLTGDDVTMRSQSASSCNFLTAASDGVFIYSDDVIDVESPLTRLKDRVEIERLTVERDAQVKGKATFDSNIVILSANGGSDFWLQYVNSNNELVFESKHGTTMTLIDEFRPEVLNFTGKHRCRPAPGFCFDAADVEDMMGKIVVSAGSYCDLDGRCDIVAVDEAIPEVDFSRKERDKRVFGVIGGVQAATPDGSMDFYIGNVAFKRKRSKHDGVGDGAPRLIIQSAGEGTVRVNGTNGDLENGDFITTSDVPGIGMKQDEPCVMNYTVARATCDCAFSSPEMTKVIGCVYSV